MSAYKVVGRYPDKDAQKPWSRGKPGTQAKKSTYICKEDFDKYSPELIQRWIKSNGYIIEVYEMTDNGWQKLS